MTARHGAAGWAAGALVAALVGAVPAVGQPAPALAAGVSSLAGVKQPVAVGYGGAVSTVDLDATEAGLGVLRGGGNAVDAAVAAAATLGVTEPYSTGIGGGGFFVYYQAGTGRVFTIDGRESAPRRSEEHTSELQSRRDLVCRLLLEK